MMLPFWVLGALLAAGAACARPQMAASVSPMEQVSNDFDASLNPVTPDLELDSPELARAVTGSLPEGIHITPWQETSDGWEVLVSWQTGDAVWGLTGEDLQPNDPTALTPLVQLGPASGQVNDDSWMSSAAASNVSLVYTNSYKNTSWSAGHTYHSPVLHHVLVQGLEPGTEYAYRVGSEEGGFSEGLSFKVPGAVGQFPLRVGVIGDLGETLNATTTRELLLANDPDIVLLAGDLPYADRYCSDGTFLDYKTVFCLGDSDQRRWDSWVRMHAPILSRVPLLHCPGNHEAEVLLEQGDIVFQAYNSRFPVPQDPDAINTSPNYADTFLNTTGNMQQFVNSAAVQPNNSYYSVDIQGVHLISLSNYVPYGNDSRQFQWLLQDLAAVDRERTPWLVVMFHEAPYHTYDYHFKEREEFMSYYEPLFYEAGVDLVICGHVHAYERTLPMFNYTADPCGPQYLVVGNAGNVEGMVGLGESLLTSTEASKVYIDEQPEDFCNDTSLFQALKASIPLLLPTTMAGKPLLTFQGGQFCPSSQPEWSAFRDPSFGHGILNLLNATHATWEFFRNQDGGAFAADSITITKAPAQCRGPK